MFLPCQVRGDIENLLNSASSELVAHWNLTNQVSGLDMSVIATLSWVIPNHFFMASTCVRQRKIKTCVCISVQAFKARVAECEQADHSLKSKLTMIRKELKDQSSWIEKVKAAIRAKGPPLKVSTE